MNRYLAASPLLLCLAVGQTPDTRTNRLAALDEVEKACGLPAGLLDRKIAEVPARTARWCTPTRSRARCDAVRLIDLGVVFHAPLLCKRGCVGDFTSSGGYRFGLHTHAFTVEMGKENYRAQCLDRDDRRVDAAR